MDTTINFWAVILSAISSMIIGSIWYGPLFGKKFMEAMGMNKWTQEEQEKMKKKMFVTYSLQFLASLLMFFILAWYIKMSIFSGLKAGLSNAFGLWLGFVVPLSFGNALWGGKMTLFWLNIGNMLLTLLAAGAIIALLQ